MEQRLIFDGRWSKCFHADNLFVKELKHYEPMAAVREFFANRVAFEAGVKTPCCIRYDITGNLPKLYYPYFKFSMLTNKLQYDQILSVLTEALRIQEIDWDKTDLYWYTKLMPDFKSALSYLPDDNAEFLKLLNNLHPEVFVHGDLSYENVGIYDSAVWVFDFQHGSLGLYGWDCGYFLGSIYPSKSLCNSLSPLIKKIALCCSAIKFGRAIRKSDSTVFIKEKIYQSWKKSI